MPEAAGHKLDHLSPAASRLGAVFARPKVVAIACVVLLAGLGWAYLALLAAGVNGPISAFDVLCRAMADSTPRPTGVALVALMWGAMTLAMMLPSAGPMIFT